MHGIAFVPQGRNLFGQLSVIENLELGGITLGARHLHEIVKALPSGIVTLRRADNQYAEVRAGKVEYKMVGMADRDFPKLPNHREVEFCAVEAGARGVADLLDQWAEADLVINENDRNTQVGSRITANLLLARPTATTGVMLRWLRAYLDARLSREAVTRWIDQIALNLARHHLALRAPEAKVGTFDTQTDINNVMFREYVPDHPFRFLSLYHGFDTSTLEE